MFLGLHTADTIANKLKTMLFELPKIIHLKVVAVHDSASNMKRAFQKRSLIDESSSCADHPL